MTYPFVEYVIVYDDRTRSSLVPMSATNPDGITVGLLFVSHATGIQLHKAIMGQSDATKQEGGILITMDARSPSLPPSYNQTQQWMLAAMAGFFTFLACFGCLLVCIQTGYIPADGRIYIGRLATNGVVGERRRLLTEAQVYGLPEQEFVSGGAENAEGYQNAAGCAICIEEFQEGETLRVLPCSHQFHTECIVPWLTERQASCPLCKHEIVGVDGEVAMHVDGGGRGEDGTEHRCRQTTWTNVETPHATHGSTNSSLHDPATTTTVPIDASTENEADVDALLANETT